MNKMSLGVSLLVLTGVIYSYNAVATALNKLRWAGLSTDLPMPQY
jgi:hypothetical protein